MMNAVMISFRTLLLMTLLLGGIYPLIVTTVGKILFPIRSQGSIVMRNDRPMGSELIAQKFTKDGYFWSRPSAVDYMAQSAGASQKSGTSKDLRSQVEERMGTLGKDAPGDLLYASASGLDPHISVEAARYQSGRVMKARNLTPEKIKDLINDATEERFLGFMGQPRVNVLKLNLLLDGNNR